MSMKSIDRDWLLLLWLLIGFVTIILFCTLGLCVLSTFFQYIGASDEMTTNLKDSLGINSIMFLVSLIALYWSGKILDTHDRIEKEANSRYSYQMEVVRRARLNRMFKAVEFTVGERTYELINYKSERDKEGVSLNVIHSRGMRLRASMSRDHGEYIYKHRDSISNDFHGDIEFLFPCWYEKDVTEELVGSKRYKEHRYDLNDCNSLGMSWSDISGWDIYGHDHSHYDSSIFNHDYLCLVRYKSPIPQEEPLKKITIGGLVYRVHPIMELFDNLSIHGKEMRNRGESLHASMSTEDCESIYRKRDQIPTDCRYVKFVFPDCSNSNERITYIIWNGSQWVKRYESLNSNKWDDSFCFLIYERRSD